MTVAALKGIDSNGTGRGMKKIVRLDCNRWLLEARW